MNERLRLPGNCMAKTQPPGQEDAGTRCRDEIIASTRFIPSEPCSRAAVKSLTAPRSIIVAQCELAVVAHASAAYETPTLRRIASMAAANARDSASGISSTSVLPAKMASVTAAAS